MANLKGPENQEDMIDQVEAPADVSKKNLKKITDKIHGKEEEIMKMDK